MEALGIGRVEGVGVGEGVGGDLDLVAAEAPADAPAEGKLEARERLHDDAIGHETVKGAIGEQFFIGDFFERIARRRGIAVHTHGNAPGGTPCAGGGIVVDDVDAIATRPGAERLVGDFDLRAENSAAIADTRIEREDGKLARRVVGHGALLRITCGRAEVVCIALGESRPGPTSLTE